MPILDLIDEYSTLIQEKEYSPVEIDDVTLLGLEILS
jgi:hypothetical protein